MNNVRKPDLQFRRDLQGNLMHSQKSGLESLNMHDMSVSTNTMRVMLENGIINTDKVVKE